MNSDAGSGRKRVRVPGSSSGVPSGSERYDDAATSNLPLDDFYRRLESLALQNAAPLRDVRETLGQKDRKDDERFARLEAQLARANDALDRFVEDRKGDAEKIATLEAENLDLRKQISELDARLRSLKHSNQERREALESSERDRRAAEQAMSEIRSGHASMEGMVRQLLEENAFLRSAREAAESERRRIERESVEIASERARTADAAVNEKRALEKENAELRVRAEAAAAGLRRLENERSSFEVKLAVAAGETRVLESAIAELRARAASAESEKKELIVDVARLDAENQRLVAEVERAKASAAATSSRKPAKEAAADPYEVFRRHPVVRLGGTGNPEAKRTPQNGSVEDDMAF